jgi:hypothetical protein
MMITDDRIPFAGDPFSETQVVTAQYFAAVFTQTVTLSYDVFHS